ncbi:MAG: phenylacetate--CoA ligase family protein [Candidatus Aenigmarchaeota archaeon]|nr:phenylacetate--CoA ligase family protein [Candidatus Aenigmarchaeota archaeon]
MRDLPIISDTIKLYNLKRVLSIQFKQKELIQKLQLKKLKNIVQYAYKHVPFYRKYWKKNGFHPSKLKTLDDIGKIPPINKQIIKRNYNDFISIDFRDYTDIMEFKNVFLFMRSTSGTTGKPLRIYLNYAAKYYLDSVYTRALMNIGYKPTKPLLYFWWKKYPDRSVYHSFGLFRKIYVPISWTEEKQLELIMKIKPEYIYYYPSALYIMSRIILKENIDIGFKPKLIITHAELLTEKMRKKIENAFDTKVYDQYGSGESVKMAWECKERNGYHIDADAVFVEITDDKFEEVDYGETGKVLLTSFVNKAMPLIRYEIGDYATKADHDQMEHKCGINLPVYIKRIEGRYEHSIKKKKKLLTQRMLLEKFQNVLDDINSIIKYQIFINESIKTATIYIETKKRIKNVNKKIPRTITGFKTKVINHKIFKNKKTGKIILLEKK